MRTVQSVAATTVTLSRAALNCALDPIRSWDDIFQWTVSEVGTCSDAHRIRASVTAYHARQSVQLSSGVGTDLSVNRLDPAVYLWSAGSSRFSSPFIAVLPLLVLTLPTVLPHLRPLSTDPFPDEGRTVSECCAVGFDDCQEPHRVAIDQIDVLEIDDKRAAVRTERRTKDVQVFRFNSPTYVQDR